MDFKIKHCDNWWEKWVKALERLRTDYTPENSMYVYMQNKIQPSIIVSIPQYVFDNVKPKRQL